MKGSWNIKLEICLLSADLEDPIQQQLKKISTAFNTTKTIYMPQPPGSNYFSHFKEPLSQISIPLQTVYCPCAAERNVTFI